MRQSFWKKRVRRDQGLSPGARHLANCLADLHWDAGAKHVWEEAGITFDAIFDATGWRSKNTVRKYRAELVAAGWLQWRPVHRDHRQRPTLYRLTEQPADESRGHGLTPESRGQTGQGLTPAPEESRGQTSRGSRGHTCDPRSTKYLQEGVGHEPRSGELVVDDRPGNPEPADTTALLDELGIRRRKA